MPCRHYSKILAQRSYLEPLFVYKDTLFRLGAIDPSLLTTYNTSMTVGIISEQFF